MPWTKLDAGFPARSVRENCAISPRKHLICATEKLFRRSRRSLRNSIVFLPLIAVVLSTAAPDKHLSIFSTAANYSVAILQRDNRDYIGLLELLEPLGTVSARADGPRWRVRYNRVVADFQSGKTHARVQGRDLNLSAPFLLDSGRGLLPVSSLNDLLPRILGGPVTLHELSGRLFIGSIATHFTASLAGDNPPRLVLNFSSPVSPSIATESGTLRMTFTREPVVAPASTTLTFGNKTIPSAAYSEGNGAAVITVNTTAAVFASFSNGGRTITIGPTSAPAQTAQAPATPSLTQNIPSASPAVTPAPAPSQPAQPRRYFAVIDAAHGGEDKGEALGPTLLEKDINIALAHSLRQELESRGMTTLLLRDSDTNLSPDQRASSANASRAAIYIALHTASSGHGIRIYTALLPYGDDDRGPFLSWTTAQRLSIPLSQAAATAISGELQRRQIPSRQLTAPLRPLNNLTVPAIAVEISPQGSDARQLTAPDYQQLVTSAVATALAATRNQFGATP